MAYNLACWCIQMAYTQHSWMLMDIVVGPSVRLFVYGIFSKVRVGAKEGGSHYWEMAVAITCGYRGYLLPLLAAHSSFFTIFTRWLFKWFMTYMYINYGIILTSIVTKSHNIWRYLTIVTVDVIFWNILTKFVSHQIHSWVILVHLHPSSLLFHLARLAQFCKDLHNPNLHSLLLGYWNNMAVRFWLGHDCIIPWGDIPFSSNHIHFRLMCCPCPILWGLQYQAISNTGSPCISVKWVNVSTATLIDISLPTFRTCRPGPSFFFSAGNMKFVIDLIQEIAHCTWPYHLSRRQQRRDVMCLVSSFCISEVEGVSSLSLMPQIQQIMAWWLQQSCCSSGASMVPTFCYHGTQLSKHRPHTCTPCHKSWARGVWRLGQARVSGSNGTVTAPTGAQCITNVAESGFGIKPGAVGIHFSHNLAINEPRLTLTPRADIVSVFDKSLSYATARLVDHSMHCEHRMEFLPTPLQQTGQGYLPDFCRTSWSSPETRNLVFFMMRQSTLLSIPALNALSLEIHSSWVSAMKTRSSV